MLDMRKLDGPKPAIDNVNSVVVHAYQRHGLWLFNQDLLGIACSTNGLTTYHGSDRYANMLGKRRDAVIE